MAKTRALQYLRAAMVDNGDLAGGQFTTASNGRTWTQAVGEGEKLADNQKNILALYMARRAWAGVTKGNVDVLFTYAVDGASKNPRSGNVVLTYQYVQHITGTKNGVATDEVVPLYSGSIVINDPNLVNRILKQP